MKQHILEFKHICFKYRSNSELLFDHLDMTLKTGEVVGILGGSGSGKTTLTEILLERLKPTCQDFQIYEDGQLVTHQKPRWSYVPQQNLLRDYLKVSEIFTVYGDSYLKTLSKSDRQERIQSVVQDLGLSEFWHKQVSQLSGGQKRRVSIGIELLSPSAYFILDEPSSGLDALSDRNLLRTLRILAKTSNKAILVVTHNTENLAIFDRLIFLSKGLPKFVGSFEELLHEFKTTDPYTLRKYLDLNIADIYQELLTSGKIYRI
ncbi:ATP-binding cassette domain-containing protein [Streptococcus thoraltensis]|uniref:ATP-binding cassette domain-containing protein n=1 Tax=Streptococcus thoraltensis TaxID=55085 RepID=UPI001F58DD3E|nr:ABC transporter ATP-binding protein [Streptococcus thoraltensis]